MCACVFNHSWNVKPGSTFQLYLHPAERARESKTETARQLQRDCSSDVLKNSKSLRPGRFRYHENCRYFHCDGLLQQPSVTPIWLGSTVRRAWDFHHTLSQGSARRRSLFYMLNYEASKYCNLPRRGAFNEMLWEGHQRLRLWEETHTHKEMEGRIRLPSRKASSSENEPRLIDSKPFSGWRGVNGRPPLRPQSLEGGELVWETWDAGHKQHFSSRTRG